jgi:hypothetical protein
MSGSLKSRSRFSSRSRPGSKSRTRSGSRSRSRSRYGSRWSNLQRSLRRCDDDDDDDDDQVYVLPCDACGCKEECTCKKKCTFCGVTGCVTYECGGRRRSRSRSRSRKSKRSRSFTYPKVYVTNTRSRSRSRSRRSRSKSKSRSRSRSRSSRYRSKSRSAARLVLPARLSRGQFLAKDHRGSRVYKRVRGSSVRPSAGSAYRSGVPIGTITRYPDGYGQMKAMRLALVNGSHGNRVPKWLPA